MRAVLLFIVLAWAGFAHAGTPGVVLSWTPPATDSDTNASIAVYHVLYGTATGVYTNSLTAYDSDADGLVISGLQNNKTYYFAIIATDTDGNNSSISSEVAITLAIPQPVVLQTQLYTDDNGVPFAISISGTNSVVTDWELDSSSDLVHWNYVTGDHGIDIYDVEYFDGPGQMFYRVVDGH